MPLKLVKQENKKDERDDSYDPPELKTCPTCGANTYGEIYKCCECGIPICDSCAFYGDVDLNNGDLEADAYFCDKCYEKVHAKEVAEKADNSTLFDVLTSELEVEVEVGDDK